MPTRAKVSRSTPRRRTPAVASRPSRSTKARPPAQRKKPAATPAQTTNNGINTYARALRYLNTLSDFERLRIVRYNSQNFDLNRMRNLLRKLGNPQDQFKSVHVAGTKGKGSTCAMIASMLQACGYKVGLYSSPHLIDIRERIQINGEMISQADFTRVIRKVEPGASKIKPQPTYFDVLTAAAFTYFADQGVDIAVIETGLGGRLDSTNVIKPEVTAITSISKDHMAQLGNTLTKIATEKAGIFKKGVPAVTVEQRPEVEGVLAEIAAQVNAPLDVLGKTIEFSYRFESSRMQGANNRICLTTPNSRFEHLAVPLLGEHQAHNCGLALSVIDRLKSRGFEIDDNLAREGLSRTTLPGRMEIVSTNPKVVVDGAHNAASLDAAMRAIGQHIPYDSMVVIFGCCADKDVPGMLERITSGADKVIFTRVDNIRSANPEELAAQYIELYGKMAQVAGNLQEALAIANRAVTREDLICITGSFYLVGEAKRYFAARAAAAAAAL
jgi:dihydrofolate synthase / folylpolyglutamate synthase